MSRKPLSLSLLHVKLLSYHGLAECQKVLEIPMARWHVKTDGTTTI
jgi:hypothetical protein